MLPKMNFGHPKWPLAAIVKNKNANANENEFRKSKMAVIGHFEKN